MTAATRTLKFWMTLAHISLGYENNTQTVEALKTNFRREIKIVGIYGNNAFFCLTFGNCPLTSARYKKAVTLKSHSNL